MAGNIIEENHYAYGLKITAISSRKMGDIGEGKLSNPYQYNDKEMLDEDADLNWYDYGYRSYDPQIGRFPQLDPLTDYYPFYTPFQFAGNDPIANVDIDGLEPGGAVGGAASAMGGFTYTYNAGTSLFLGPAAHAISAAATSGKGVLNLISSLTSILVKTSVATCNIINTSFNTEGIGPGERALINARGFSDALYNANVFGLYDLFGGNHLKEYSDPEDQKSYLTGRLLGDAAAVGFSLTEIESGGGTALATAIETGGVGALIGIGIAIHGAGTGSVAANDAVWVLQKLYKLSSASSGTVAEVVPKKGGQAPNDMGRAAEKATNSDIHPNKERYIGNSGKSRIADRSTPTTLEETKNVAYQYWSSQLRDAYIHAKNTKRIFILWLRKSTRISKELKRQIDMGHVIRKDIRGIK
mgnify:CR=1 FL=1